MGHCGQSIAVALCCFKTSLLQHGLSMVCRFPRQLSTCLTGVSPGAQDASLLGASRLSWPLPSLSPLSPACWAVFCPPFPRLSLGISPTHPWLSGSAGPCTGTTSDASWANPSQSSSSLKALSQRHCTTWGSWSVDWTDRPLPVLQTNKFLVSVFIYKLYRSIWNYLLGAVNKARKYCMKCITVWSAHFWALANSEFGNNVKYHWDFWSAQNSCL